ncbi:MAG: MAPEG family protein [Rhodobacteraceae bacterium]|nr:MAPEG family protein [Paracoccaceae bacterium]
MTSELSILALYGFVIAITILIQVTAALGQASLLDLARSRDDLPDLTGIAGRLLRAVNNSIVAMALFAPAVLILEVKGIHTAQTLLAAQVFLIARIAYVPIYAFGIPWLRTLVWITGFLATLLLYWMSF